MLFCRRPLFMSVRSSPSRERENEPASKQSPQSCGGRFDALRPDMVVPCSPPSKCPSTGCVNYFQRVRVGSELSSSRKDQSSLAPENSKALSKCDHPRLAQGRGRGFAQSLAPGITTRPEILSASSERGPRSKGSPQHRIHRLPGSQSPPQDDPRGSTTHRP